MLTSKPVSGSTSASKNSRDSTDFADSFVPLDGRPESPDRTKASCCERGVSDGLAMRTPHVTVAQQVLCSSASLTVDLLQTCSEVGSDGGGSSSGAILVPKKLEKSFTEVTRQF